MRLGAAFGGSSATVGAAAATAVALVVGAVAFVALREDPAAPPPAPEVADGPGPTATGTGISGEEAAEPGTGAVAEDPAPAPAPAAPRFDVVRVAPDGSAVIAGQAAPGAAVTLVIDGAEIATTEADAGGDFVALLTLAPSETPRILSLSSSLPQGAALDGTETVMITPFGAPEPDPAEVLASAAPDPAAAVDGADPAGPTAPDDPATVAVLDAAEAPDPAAEPDPPATAEAREETAPAPAADETTEVASAETPAPEAAGADAPLAVADAPVPGAETVPEPQAYPEDAAAEAPGPEAPEVVASDAAPETSGTAPTVLIAGPEGLRVAQGGAGAPDAQTEVQLDAITYDIEGAVQISGRGLATREVQVFLNNQPIQMGEIGPGGAWSLDLPDVDPGTYTLRVAQISPEGAIEAEVETPFLREDPARIAENPMLVAPGVSVITVQPGFTLWGIAEANFGEGIAYVQIFAENRDRIRDPHWIFPGQIFRLPERFGATATE